MRDVSSVDEDEDVGNGRLAGVDGIDRDGLVDMFSA
jgi:hypothetical protein